MITVMLSRRVLEELERRSVGMVDGCHGAPDAYGLMGIELQEGTFEYFDGLKTEGETFNDTLERLLLGGPRLN